MITLLLQNYLLFLAVLLVGYVTGFFLLKAFFKNTSLSSAEVMFLGLIVSVSIFTVSFAALKTGGKTVLCLLPIVALVIKIFHRQSISGSVIPQSVNFPQMFPANFKQYLVVSVMVFAWYSLRIVKSGSYPFVAPHIDNVYYANLSYFISESGQENRFGAANFLDPIYHGISPYHYFDLWANAMFVFFTGKTSITCFYFITYPFFAFILFSGLLAVLKPVAPIKWQYLFLVFLLLFTTALGFRKSNTLENVDTLFYQGMSYIESPFETFGEKYTIILPFILLACWYDMRTTTMHGLLMLQLLPVLSISLAPGIWGGSIFFILVMVIFKKVPWKQLGLLLLPILAASILFLLYKQIGARLNFINVENIFVYSDFTQWNSATLYVGFIELVHRLWMHPFITLFFYFPFLVLLFVFRKQLNPQQRQWLVLFFCIYVSGVLACNVFYKMRDCWQLQTNTLLIFNILLMMYIGYMLTDVIKIKPWVKAGLVVLLCCRMGYVLFFYHQAVEANNPFSDEFIAEVQKCMYEKTSAEKGAFMAGSNEISAFDSNTRDVFLAFMPQPCFTYDIGHVNDADTVLFNQVSAGFRDDYIKTTPFFRFFMKEKQQKTVKSVEEARIGFIKTHKLEFAILMPGANLNQTINVSKTIKDKKSGAVFCLF